MAAKLGDALTLPAVHDEESQVGLAVIGLGHSDPGEPGADLLLPLAGDRQRRGDVL
jgi:dihydroxyacetone kinase